MAAILFLIFGDEKLKIQLGIHHSRIQHPQNRLKRKFAIFYSKMPRMTLNELFSEIFPSLSCLVSFFETIVKRVGDCLIVSINNHPFPGTRSH